MNCFTTILSLLGTLMMPYTAAMPFAEANPTHSFSTWTTTTTMTFYTPGKEVITRKEIYETSFRLDKPATTTAPLLSFARAEQPRSIIIAAEVSGERTTASDPTPEESIKAALSSAIESWEAAQSTAEAAVRRDEQSQTQFTGSQSVFTGVSNSHLDTAATTTDESPRDTNPGYHSPGLPATTPDGLSSFFGSLASNLPTMTTVTVPNIKQEDFAVGYATKVVDFWGSVHIPYSRLG